MYCKVLLITLGVLMVVFHQGFSLMCSRCYSHDSWDHCDKTATKENCTKNLGSRDVSCIKGLRYKKKEDNQEKWVYMKRCFETRKCNKDFCLLPMDSSEELEKIIATGCDVDCCKDKDFCNGGHENKVEFSLLMVILLSSTSMF